DEAGAAVQPTPVLQSAAATSRRSATPVPRWLVRVGAAVALMALAAGLTWLAIERGHTWRSPLANARFIRLPEFAGTERAAAISPNGKYIAFVAEQDGHTDAWLSVVGSGTYRNLTQGAVGDLVNPAIRTPAFSADSALVSLWTRLADGSQPGDV